MAPTGDPTIAFLEELAARGHDPLVHGANGTLRLDLSDDGDVDRWYVVLSKGDIKVARRGGKADAVLRVDRSLFDGMAQGTVNAMAALLRNVLHVEGDLGLVTLFARLLPGPAASKRSFLERQKELHR